jgi:AbrB family looped-hinge helix DNA binding protein
MELVEYLTTSFIGEKGQVTVPKNYRATLGLKAGSPIAILRIGDGLMLLPEQSRFEELCDSIAETLSAANITEEDLQKTLPTARQRVVSRRYPKLLPASKTKRKQK